MILQKNIFYVKGQIFFYTKERVKKKKGELEMY